MADEKNVGAAAADAANPQEAVVRVEGLQKSFGNNVVLRDINLTVMPGQVVTIIGASGSGKSTLLRCINLLETPDAGHVWFHGKDLAAEHVDINALREKIGMVFQSFNLFNNMNVLDNCTLAPVTLKKMTKEQAEKVALANLDSVGLADFAGADVNTLSGGQKQRVAIARALAMDTEILLFDEPFGALDVRTRRDLQELMSALWVEADRDRRKTAVFVTHDIDEALLLADRIVFMSDGRFLADIPVGAARPRDPEEFLRRPAVRLIQDELMGLFYDAVETRRDLADREQVFEGSVTL